MKNITLKGLVISTYGSVRNFASNIGWSYRKASYILNGRQEPTASDIELMTDKLEIETSDLFRSLFFKNQSTKCGHDTA